MLNHRYRRLTGDSSDQAIAAPGNNDIDKLAHRDEFAYVLSIRIFNHLHDRRRQADQFQAKLDTSRQGQGWSGWTQSPLAK